MQVIEITSTDTQTNFTDFRLTHRMGTDFTEIVNTFVHVLLSNITLLGTETSIKEQHTHTLKYSQFIGN